MKSLFKRKARQTTVFVRPATETKTEDKEINMSDNKKTSVKGRKPPNRPGGFKRRNSTTVSSIKIKKPPKDAVKSPTSFDIGDDGPPPMSPQTPSEKNGETHFTVTAPEEGSENPEETNGGQKISEADPEATSSANEEELLADLNATLAKAIEKDKIKSKKKFRIIEPPKTPENEKAEPDIEPEKLLKPTDIPKHVIDEKKSDRKTEKETKATEAEVKDENSQKPVEVVTNKNDPQVPVQVPKSPSATRKKGKGKQTVMVQKKSKFMIEPEVAKTLTAKERERKLKEIVVEAFVTAAWRYERAESNKWLRWKYAGMESKKNDWLDKNGVEDMGWAVGRRIYEKEEIERVDERLKLREKSTLFEKRNVSLKEAPAVFGLWDNVYHQNGIKSLDEKGRWDPTQASKAREKKKEIESSSDESGDSDSNDDDPDDNDDPDDPDEEVKYDDDGNPIVKKKKKKKKKKKRKGSLSNEGDFGKGLKDDELKWLLSKTSYSEKEIQAWYLNFKEECPSGKLTKSHMQRLFKRVFPVGDSEHFCDFIFRLFDEDGNNVLEFKEFLQAIDVVTRKSEDEKLKWAFRLFDKDGSGKINVHEMASVLETMQGLEGKAGSNNNSAYKFAEKVFKLMDDDRDGEIEVDEFVKGYQKLKARQNSSSVTVTAMVREVPKSKPKPRQATTALEPTKEHIEESSTIRRKSLRDPGVKSLFSK